ncbi:MAG: hypothetical protein ABIR54_14145 [Burkholderiaceae bacterium]
MPRDFFARLLRWFALMVALTGLAACSNDYPSDWPPIVSPWFGACPDLSGSYDIAGGGPFKPPGVGAKLPFSSAWQTLTIVSRSGGLVDLTWLRPAGSSGLPTGLDRHCAGRRPTATAATSNSSPCWASRPRRWPRRSAIRDPPFAVRAA